MKKLFHFVVILFCSCSGLDVFAQTREIDSLKELIILKEGIDRFNVLRELIIVTQDSHPHLALECAEACVKLIPELQDSLNVMFAYKVKGLFLLKVGQERDAFPFLDKALHIAKRNRLKDHASDLSNTYGLCLMNIGEYGRALDMFLQALALKSSNDEGIRLCVLYNNIGLVYYRLGNNAKAIENFQKSLIDGKKLDRWIDTERVLVNMALAFSKLNNYSMAMNKLQYAFSLCRSKCYRAFELEGESGLGMVKYEMGNLVESETHLNRSLWLARSSLNFRYISLNLSFLGRIYSDLGRYELAESCLLEAERIALEKGYTALLSESYWAFIQLFMYQDDYYKLSAYYNKINKLSEGEHRRSLLENVSAFEVEMEHEANLKTIVYQNQLLNLQNDSLRQEQRIYYGISVLIVLILLILLLLSRRSVQRKKIKELLEKRINQRTESLERKTRHLAITKIDLTENADKRFGVVSRLLNELQDAAIGRPVHYRLQLQSTITQMRFVFDSIEYSKNQVSQERVMFNQ